MKLSIALSFGALAFAAAAAESGGDAPNNRELWQQQPPPHHPSYDPWQATKPAPTHKAHGKVTATHINEALEVGQGKVVLRNGPFEVKARCLKRPENRNPFLPDVFPIRRTAIQLEVTAKAMKEDLLVYGTGYTVFPGFLSDRAIEIVEQGTETEYLLFRVDNILSLITGPDFSPSDDVDAVGGVFNNPFSGGFSSSNGYHIALDGDSCIGLVSDPLPLNPSDEDDTRFPLDDFFGEGTDCAISCIIHSAEPKEIYQNPW